MKHLLPLLAATALLVACTGGFDYSIDGSIPGAPDSTVVYLTNYDTGDTIDTAMVAGEHFNFAGHGETAFMARLLVGSHRIDFIVENGQLVIDSLGNVSGSPLNAALNAMADSLDTIEDDDAAIAYFHNLYEANKENPLGLYALSLYTMYSSPSTAQIDSLLAAAPQHCKDSKRMAKLRKSAENKEKTAPGQPMVDFEVTGDDGKVQRLSDYVGKGKYAIVDFWASWCGPCRREMPNLKAIRATHGDKIVMLGVAVWDEPADTRAAIKDLELPWPVIVGSERLTEPTDLYGIDGIPHIIIFDPQGTIVARGLYGEALAGKVDELLKQ